ncbi:hypothetical protein WAI453_003045 [Rhynchosporium graminicola]
MMSSTPGYQIAISINRAQNASSFQINTEKEPIIFAKDLFSKTLDPPREDPTEPRLVTIECLYKGYTKVFKGQRVNHSTSNYITYYKFSHKAFNIRRVLMQLDSEPTNIENQS